ncbi:MAG: serine protease [Pirellulales bacterium]|nr:serine protease [Pirellulales bacterium]
MASPFARHGGFFPFRAGWLVRLCCAFCCAGWFYPGHILAQLNYPADTPQLASQQSWWQTLWGAPGSQRSIPVAQGRAVSKTPHPAIARIIAPEKKSLALGSGTLIAKTATYGLVITNWHVVRDATHGAVVVFPDGTQYQGRVVKTDRDWDLAAIVIPPPGVEPLPLTTVAPKLGETLWIAGYGSGDYLLQTGRCSQYLAPAANWPLEIVELGAAARQGDSGGPILNARGEVAGVLFGQGDGYTSGAYGGRVVEFLDSLPPLEKLAVPGTPRPKLEQLANVSRQNQTTLNQTLQNQAPQSQLGTQPLSQTPDRTKAAINSFSNPSIRPTRDLAVALPNSPQASSQSPALPVASPLLPIDPVLSASAVPATQPPSGQPRQNQGNFFSPADRPLTVNSHSGLPPLTTHGGTVREFSLWQFAGDNAWEQVKSVFALAGFLLFFFNLCGWLVGRSA